MNPDKAKAILKKVRQLEIRTNRLVNDSLAGEYHSVFKGQGMAFSEVRPYTPGDDIRHIDWNVTARHQNLFVKQFIEERELTVMLLADMSGSGELGTRVKTKRRLLAEVGALVAFSAIKNNDRVGLYIVTDRVERFVPPAKGTRHVLRVIRDVLFFEPSRLGTSLVEGLDFLNRVQRRRAVVFLFSDFFDSGYLPHVLPALYVMGAGMGLIFGSCFNTKAMSSSALAGSAIAALSSAIRILTSD